MQLQSTKIFIVDDTSYCRSFYEQHLNNLGYTDIISLDDGQECLNRISENPEIIFLDYRMDPMNGLEILKKIKRVNPDIFIILLSAQEDMQIAIDALKFGAFDYIIKEQNDLESITKNMNKIVMLKKLIKEKQNERKPSFINTFFNL